MTVLTIFAANSSAADVRDTFNQMLADIAALQDTDGGGGGTTPPTTGVIYNQTASDTGYVDLTSSGGKLETFLNDTPFVTDMISDADGQPCYRIKQAANGFMSGYVVDSSGNESVDSVFNFINFTSSFSSTPATFIQNGGAVRVECGGTVKEVARTAGGTFIRHRTGGAAVTSTVTKN